MLITYKKRIRLKDFDYKGCYRYFITLCTFNKKPLFNTIPVGQGVGRKVGQGFSPAEASLKACPTLNDGCTTVTWLIDILREKSNSFGFKIWAYCFMPDHLHLLIEGKEPDSEVSTVFYFLQ